MFTFLTTYGEDQYMMYMTLVFQMTSSGVKGVTSSAVDYVRSALLPEQTNSEATASFTRYDLSTVR